MSRSAHEMRKRGVAAIHGADVPDPRDLCGLKRAIFFDHHFHDLSPVMMEWGTSDEWVIELGQAQYGGLRCVVIASLFEKNITI